MFERTAHPSRFTPLLTSIAFALLVPVYGHEFSSFQRIGTTEFSR